MRFKSINHEQAKELMLNGSVLLLDVRDDESFAQSHIPEAVHLSVADLQALCEATPVDQSILIYCHHGISSQSVAQHFVYHVFTNVYSLTGGFEVWKSFHPTSSQNQ